MRERELIDKISQLVGKKAQGLLLGIGDDCAVIEKNDETVWLVTMDTLVESVHFDLNWHPPGLLGRKSISVNVSDIAAMGGRPCFVLLSLGLPAGFAEKWTDELTQGIIQACNEYDCLLIGGDTVCSPDKAVLTITVIGEMAKKRVLYRHGAREGDVVWVSGSLGNAAAGLDLFKAEKGGGPGSFQPLLEAHLDPCARVELAVLLAETKGVRAMIDLSDGLATDLSHLCRQSNVGARIIANQLPAQRLLQEAAEVLSKDPLDWMVAGGEDYELLFTAGVDATAVLEQLTRKNGHILSPIGRIVEGSGVVLIQDSVQSEDTEQNISYQGYEHFKKN